jgi:probable HAF family extracellular repeat protein
MQTLYPDPKSRVHRLSRDIFVSLAVLLAGSVSLAVAQPAYTITDLGNEGMTSAEGLAINNNGVVAGEQTLVVPDPNEPLEVIYNNPFISVPGGVMTPVGPYQGEVVGMNDADEIVGTDIEKTQAYSYTTGGGVVDLGAAGGTYKYSVGAGINNVGEIVGDSSQLVGGVGQPFVYTVANGLQPLTYAPGQSPITNAVGINDNGQIIGSDSNGHAAIYSLTTGMVQDLGSLSSEVSIPTAINDLGQVVGVYQIDSTEHEEIFNAFIYTPGSRMLNIGDFTANDINASGEVVGTYGYTPYATPILYTSSTGMVDVNSLLPELSGWQLYSANAINNLGQITGEGIDPSGQDVAYVLTPVPEPETVALLIGSAALVMRRREEKSSQVSVP